MTGTSISEPILLAGPTASGKSDVALALAERLDGEIIAVDSMQVYRGLDIGTAKPSSADRERVPHHLLDVVTLREQFDAAQFVGLARQAVKDIQCRGKVPILCGGTGFYFKAYLEGLGSAPPPSAALREQLRRMPLADLLKELEENDPATFARIDRANPRRVIRAVEVIRLTGEPFSAQRARWTAGLDARTPGAELNRSFYLSRSASDLRQRIDGRVDEMFRSGLVEETQQLLAAGLDQNPVALQALGYRQVVEHLQGLRDLEQTIQLVKIRTWQFARRQLKWSKRQLSFRWIAVAPEDSPQQIAARVIEFASGRVRAGTLMNAD